MWRSMVERQRGVSPLHPLFTCGKACGHIGTGRGFPLLQQHRIQEEKLLPHYAVHRRSAHSTVIFVCTVFIVVILWHDSVVLFSFVCGITRVSHPGVIFFFLSSRPLGRLQQPAKIGNNQLLRSPSWNKKNIEHPKGQSETLTLQGTGVFHKHNQTERRLSYYSFFRVPFFFTAQQKNTSERTKPPPSRKNSCSIGKGKKYELIPPAFQQNTTYRARPHGRGC